MRKVLTIISRDLKVADGKSGIVMKLKVIINLKNAMIQCNKCERCTIQSKNH